MVGHVEHSDLIVQVTADVDSAIGFQNFNNDKQVREIILPPSLRQEFNAWHLMKIEQGHKIVFFISKYLV